MLPAIAIRLSELMRVYGIMNKSYPYYIYFSRQFQKVKGGKKRFWTYRKSSSMSSTLASKLLEVFSFNSNSRIRLVIIIVLRVIGFPGRCIRNIHGSHWRNSVRTCSIAYIQKTLFASSSFRLDLLTMDGCAM